MSSLESLSAFEIACLESRSLVLECDLMHALHLSEPETSGSSQAKQQTAKPIMFIAERGRLTVHAHLHEPSTLLIQVA